MPPTPPTPERRDLVLSCRGCGQQTAPTCWLLQGLPELQRAISPSSHLSQGNRRTVTPWGRGTKAISTDLGHSAGQFLLAKLFPELDEALSNWGYSFISPFLPHPASTLSTPSLYFRRTQHVTNWWSVVVWEGLASWVMWSGTASQRRRCLSPDQEVRESALQ